MQHLETKCYHVVWREHEWQLVIEGHKSGLLQSDDRSYLVQIACRVAAERGCSVHVFDDRDQLEARLSFVHGMLAVEGSYFGDLHIAAARRRSPEP
jgi:hypothetical protein